MVVTERSGVRRSGPSFVACARAPAGRKIKQAYRVVYVRFVGTSAEHDAANAQELLKMADIKPIRTEADYETALARIDELMDAEPGSPEGRELDDLVDVVHLYESRHEPMEYPDPVTAIEFRRRNRV